MRDLTQGPISSHLIYMALPQAAGMVFHTLYYFVDLYFVASLGDAAVAGLSAAGNVMTIVLAMTQVLAVGTVTLISHEAGRKDQHGANIIFNHALLVSAACAVLALIAGYAMAHPYLKMIAADDATARQGRDYLFWFIPGMAMEFVTAAMASALVGTGIVRPIMIVQVATVLLNVALAPVLISGLGTYNGMGVAGAGLASSLAVVGGLILILVYFHRTEYHISFCIDRSRPQFGVVKRILTVGWPAGGELLLGFMTATITQWAISDFGATSQAGFGIASRIMQGIVLPALAVALVVAPIAGQNYGARQMDRVRMTFRIASIQSVALMLVALVICQWQPETMVRAFSSDPEIVSSGAIFLRFISWNFVLMGIHLVCSGVFQALGNTTPLLVSSVARLVVYSLPTLWLTSQPNYKLEHVWYTWTVATVVQAAFSLVLLRKQMRLHLGSTRVTLLA